MILTAVGFLFALGTTLFVLGHVVPGIPEGYSEAVSVIGAVIVLAAGAAVTIGGVSYKSGELHSTNSTTNTTIVQYQYSQISLPVHMSLGLLLMVTGALGIMMHADLLSDL